MNGRFYINITKVNEHNIHLQEILVANDGENRIFRNWSFKKDGYWQVLSLEREGKHVILVNLLDELSDLNIRIDSIYRRLNNSGFYYTEEFIAADYDYSFEKLSLSKGRISRFFSGIYNELALHPAVFVPILSLAVLVLAFFVGSYFVQVNRIQKGLDVTIDEYLLQIGNQMKNIDSFMADAGGELEVLKENMEKSKADFDFNRHNAYVNVMRLAEELTKYLPARKEAYRLIASNILESVFLR